MATHAEFRELCSAILDSQIVKDVWISTEFSLKTLRAHKGKATKENIKQALVNGDLPTIIAGTLADTHHGQKDVSFGIVIAIPAGVKAGNLGDVDNYANAICDLMVELYKKEGSFFGDTSLKWDDAQIKDLRIIKVTSWDQDWWVSITTGTSLAPN